MKKIALIKKKQKGYVSKCEVPEKASAKLAYLLSRKILGHPLIVNQTLFPGNEKMYILLYMFSVWISELWC